jgi:hypothetical protein
VPAYRQVGPGGIWVPGRAIAHNQPEALVLSLRGTVDEIGMGRLERVLRKSGGFTFDGNYDGVTVRQLQDAIEFAELPPTYRLALVNAEGREVS